MAVSFNPSVPQAQAASVNPFQQRNEEQERSTRADEAKDPDKTRPSSASASQSQKSDTRARQREEDRVAANEDKRDARKTSGGRRGDLVDVTV